MTKLSSGPQRIEYSRILPPSWRNIDVDITYSRMMACVRTILANIARCDGDESQALWAPMLVRPSEQIDPVTGKPCVEIIAGCHRWAALPQCIDVDSQDIWVTVNTHISANDAFQLSIDENNEEFGRDPSQLATETRSIVSMAQADPKVNGFAQEWKELGKTPGDGGTLFCASDPSSLFHRYNKKQWATLQTPEGDPQTQLTARAFNADVIALRFSKLRPDREALLGGKTTKTNGASPSNVGRAIRMCRTQDSGAVEPGAFEGMNRRDAEAATNAITEKVAEIIDIKGLDPITQDDLREELNAQAIEDQYERKIAMAQTRIGKLAQRPTPPTPQEEAKTAAKVPATVDDLTGLIGGFNETYTQIAKRYSLNDDTKQKNRNKLAAALRAIVRTTAPLLVDVEARLEATRNAKAKTLDKALARKKADAKAELERLHHAGAEKAAAA